MHVTNCRFIWTIIEDMDCTDLYSHRIVVKFVQSPKDELQAYNRTKLQVDREAEVTKLLQVWVLVWSYMPQAWSTRQPQFRFIGPGLNYYRSEIFFVSTNPKWSEQWYLPKLEYNMECSWFKDFLVYFFYAIINWYTSLLWYFFLIMKLSAEKPKSGYK